MRLIAGAIMIVALCASPALADVSARYEIADDSMRMDMTMTFEVSDEGHVRLQMGSLPGYYLLRDDELYSIQNGFDGPLVVRVSDHMALQSEFAEQMFRGDPPSEFDEPIWDFAAMGEEEVNGRTGTAYGLIPEGGGEPVHAMVVIGDQPELTPLGLAMQRTNEVMLRGAPSYLMALARANAEIQSIFAAGAPLRFSQFELTETSTLDIPDERFELPTEPVMMEQLRAQLVPFDPPPTLPQP